MMAATVSLSEKQFLEQVRELAKALGYHTYHPWLSIRSERGWPDLAIWRPGRFILAELKSEKGKLTASQTRIIETLKEAGVEVHVWRPSDFDEIVELLRRPAAQVGA
jgi:hypothetical protein